MRTRLILLLTWSLACVTLATETTEMYRVGEARAAVGGDLLYRELHQLHWQDGTVQRSKVIYSSDDGMILAVMASDFSEGVALPKTRFVTAQREYSYAVEPAGPSRLAVRYQGPDGIKSKTLDVPKDAVCGQGFSYAITAGIDEWHPGKSRITPFLMPGRFDWFRFTVEAGPRDNGTQQFSMRLTNLFLRLFVGEIAMEHDLASGLLSRYAGPSNVVYDGDDKPVSVVIAYEASSGDRFAAAEAAAAKLLANAEL